MKLELLAEKWIIDQVKSQREDIPVELFREFNAKDDVEKRKIHYIITLGGDGTILYAAKQFPGSYIPPIISFAMVNKN